MGQMWVAFRIAVILAGLALGFWVALSGIFYGAIARYPDYSENLVIILIAMVGPLSVALIIWLVEDVFHHHNTGSVRQKIVSNIFYFWMFTAISLGVLSPGALVMFLAGQEIMPLDTIVRGASPDEVVSHMSWSAFAGAFFDIIEVYWPDLVDAEAYTMEGRHFIFGSRVYGLLILVSAIRSVWGVWPSRRRFAKV